MSPIPYIAKLDYFMNVNYEKLTLSNIGLITTGIVIVPNKISSAMIFVDKNNRKEIYSMYYAIEIASPDVIFSVKRSLKFSLHHVFLVYKIIKITTFT